MNTENSRGEIAESNMQILHNTLFKYKPTTVYNLDVIISVGYRVHSQRGVQFRRWANSILKDYLIKGYAVKNNIAQQKYEDLKSLVDVMGRTLIESMTLQFLQSFGNRRTKDYLCTRNSKKHHETDTII